MLTIVLLAIIAGLVLTVWTLSAVVRDRNREICDLRQREGFRRENEWAEERRARLAKAAQEEACCEALCAREELVNRIGWTAELGPNPLPDLPQSAGKVGQRP